MNKLTKAEARPEARSDPRCEARAGVRGDLTPVEGEAAGVYTGVRGLGRIYNNPVPQHGYPASTCRLVTSAERIVRHSRTRTHPVEGYGFVSDRLPERGM